MDNMKPNQSNTPESTDRAEESELAAPAGSEPTDAERLDALDEAFTMHTRASMHNQGPYMNGKNVGFSTSQFGPRKRGDFRSVREVADYIISQNNKSSNADSQQHE